VLAHPYAAASSLTRSKYPSTDQGWWLELPSAYNGCCEMVSRSQGRVTSKMVEEGHIEVVQLGGILFQISLGVVPTSTGVGAHISAKNR